MISIIVPAYNLENYIERTVRSVLNQTYQDIEVLVVDDGSQDQTACVIRKMIEKFPKKLKLIQIPNGGVANARLIGVHAAQGEWIGFVDGDDEIEPDMYEILLDNALKYQADISHCGFKMVFGDGRENYFHNTGSLVVQDRITGLKELLDGSLVEPSLCNKLFHKNLLHSLLHEVTLPKDIKINEDLLMNYYLFSFAKKSVFEDKCPYHYLVRMTSASRQKMNNNKIYDPIRVKKIILEHCDNDLKLAAETALLNTCIYTYCGLTLEERVFGQAKKEIREEILNHIQCVNNLSQRTQILAKGIIKMPKVLDRLYPIYVKYFQRKVYE